MMMNNLFVIPTLTGFLVHSEDDGSSSKSPAQQHTSLSFSVRENVDRVRFLDIKPSNGDRISDAQVIRAQAILGIVRGVSKNTFYLLLVVRSMQIGGSGLSSSFGARSVDAVRVLSFPDQESLETNADRLQVEYIESSLRNVPFLYYSHTHDIVRTLQEQSTNKNAVNLRASMFVWNWKFLEPLYDAQISSRWIHPIIQGLIVCKEGISVLDLKFDLVLITRRAITHQGTRFNCRGLDSNGHAANFCETEQIAFFKDAVAAYVQVRGSVPTLWEQMCSLSPVKQRVLLSPEYETEGFALFRKHLRTLATEGQVVFINLIDKYGHTNSSKDQARLGTAFHAHMDKVQTEEKLDAPKFVWFDFHHETLDSKGGWENLGALLHEVEPDLKEIGSFIIKHEQQQREQKGLFRVNCMDNLDRTNVVQSMFGRAALMHQLAELSPDNRALLLGGRNSKSPSVFDSGFPQLEASFKDMWADNADAVSLAYAGSFALKTDFTRTGKRSFVGRLQDTMNSTLRLFVNNFLDANKQDEIDVLLREETYIHEQLDKLTASKKRHSNVSPAKRRMLLLAMGSLGFFTRIGQKNPWPYLVVLMSIAAYVIAKQSAERPKFFRK